MMMFSVHHSEIENILTISNLEIILIHLLINGLPFSLLYTSINERERMHEFMKETEPTTPLFEILQLRMPLR